MAPLLEDGDFLLYSTRCPAKIANGKIVLARHDTLGLIVKRVKSLSTDRQSYYLEGVSCLSTASEHIGKVPHDAIHGLGLYRITRTRFFPIRLP